MKDTLGSQGVQTLVKPTIRKKKQKVKQAEKDGKTGREWQGIHWKIMIPK